MGAAGRLFGMVAWVLAGVGTLLLLPIAGEATLEQFVTPKEGDVSSWTASLLESALFSAGAILVLDLIWFFLAQWVWRVSDHRNADKRAVWFAFAAAAAVSISASAFWTATALEAGFFPWIFLFHLAFFVWGFYLATALFSPVAFKYTPLFSEKLRLSARTGK